MLALDTLTKVSTTNKDILKGFRKSLGTDVWGIEETYSIFMNYIVIINVANGKIHLFPTRNICCFIAIPRRV
jgi:hypothetical protein